jgi:antitoxin ParD1/3/4
MSAAEKLSITLPADMVSVIKAEVETGRYASTSEVLREAMRMWLRREQEHAERIQAIRGRLKRSLDDPRPNVSAEEAFARLETFFQDGTAA